MTPFVLVSVLLHLQVVLACSVCYGDPDSDMAKGAVAGVFVLFGIIGSVLSWIGGMAVYFTRRARKLAQSDTNSP